MRSRPLAAALATLMACSDGAEPEPSADAGPLPACPTERDGTCDEPSTCNFGTDAEDCMMACAQSPEPADLWGACRFLEAGRPDHAAVPEDLTARGSGGSGGPRGEWLGRVWSADERGNRESVRRGFIVYVPESYREARPAPLLLYGGGFGDAIHQGGYHDMRRLGELHGAIVIDVEQRYRDWGFRGYRHGWYTYLQAFAGDWSHNPDRDYLIKVIEAVEGLYNVDRTRIWVTGTSRGGAISIIWAFLAPEYVAGFVSQAGFLTEDVNSFTSFIETYAAAGGRKMPAVFVAGAQDDNVPPSETREGVALLESLGWRDADMLRDWQLDGVGYTPEDFGNYTGPWKVNERPDRVLELEAFVIEQHEVTVRAWVEFLEQVGATWPGTRCSPSSAPRTAASRRAAIRGRRCARSLGTRRAPTAGGSGSTCPPRRSGSARPTARAPRGSAPTRRGRAPRACTT